MKQVKLILLPVFLLGSLTFCTSKTESTTQEQESSLPQKDTEIRTGADRPSLYLPKLENKRVALAVNQTSVLTQNESKHLVDFLLEEGISVQKVFVPEHGFRGNADAGEKVENQIDPQTGLPLVSLYGDSKKPSLEALADVDLVIFDIQDVGVRFYTFISTLHYLMEACAEQGKPLMIMDRPNPSGDYIDGPVLQPGFESFVGMHPIPVVHGLTVGELAHMINGEGWLKGGVKADIEVIPIENWTHSEPYSLPVKPSPNLPNDLSIRLYPSLCFFEGTDISLGRGTLFPFQVYGYPDPKFGDFTFTPVSIEGMSKNPPHQNKVCYGKDLRSEALNHRFTLTYLLEAYRIADGRAGFFNAFFDKLAGTDELRKAIVNGVSAADIRESWKEDLENYRRKRANYLIYD
ncbi:exo-beta-N-acetylmuramidase NamZ domain-containing protein [Cyclobacterium xiamenense]|uniref:exo-beta-N-acetylmuramidase NamZ family protein n=1 Tax=Cyclobacterium xiamenense TaxID=1297121 RepID=UPI0035D032F3